MYQIFRTKYFGRLLIHWTLNEKLICYSLCIILILSGCTKLIDLEPNYSLLNNKSYVYAIDESAAQLIPQLGHAKSIGAIAISPNGNYLLTGSEDGTAIIWNIENGQQIRRFIRLVLTE